MSNEILRAILTARTPGPFADLKPYVPDPAEGLLRLDANEAPPILPTLNDAERAAWNEAITAVDPARYPDVRASKLRAVLAEKAKVDPKQIVIGCGSDELISILLSTLAAPVDGEPPLVLTPSPTFVMYRVGGRVHGYDVAEVPLDARCDLDESKISDAIAKLRPAVLFLASPNNPTSRAFDRGKIERLVEIAGKGEPPTVVVIDEAYFDYRTDGAASATELLERHGNVVVLRTLSKIGFAGLRVGWAIARGELAYEMEKARLPYDVPSISQAGALAAFTSLAPAVARHVRRVVDERARMATALESIDAVSFPRADANFFWLKIRGAAEVAAKIKEKGIVVRTHPAWGDHLRVTVGEAKDNDRFLEALRGATT